MLVATVLDNQKLLKPQTLNENNEIEDLYKIKKTEIPGVTHETIVSSCPDPNEDWPDDLNTGTTRKKGGGAHGSSVIPNPEITGSEPILSAISVDGAKFIVKGDGSSVIPNPEITGNEPILSSIRIGNDKYKLEAGVKISKETGNAIVEKTDGIFSPSINEQKYSEQKTVKEVLDELTNSNLSENIDFDKIIGEY